MADDSLDQQQLPLNPLALQQALTTMRAPAGGPTPPPQQNIPSMPPPQQEDNINLGTVPTRGGQPTQQGQTGIPRQSYEPAIVGFFHQLFGDQAARGYFPATGGGPGDLGAQPARPVSRLDAFENFLGNFMSSFSQGMANAGQGPAANARGFGAAAQAPYQRELQQYQLGQQAEQVQAQTSLQQAEAAKAQAQATMVPVQPMGPTGPTIYLPPAEAAKVTGAQIGAAGRVQAAGTQKQFISTPYGVFDTKAQDYVGAKTSAPMGQAKVTQDMVNRGVPPQFLDTYQKNTDIEGYMNARARDLTIFQTGGGPEIGSKTGMARGEKPSAPLGPSPAVNAVSMGRLGIASAEQRRTVDMQQQQVNRSLPRLQFLRDHANVVASLWDAGKISLQADPTTGLAKAIINRNVKLTPEEQEYSADLQAMAEAINILRAPQGGTGFRGEEAWEALQSQRGNLTQNLGVFKDVLNNTIQDFQSIQGVNQQALDVYDRVAGVAAGKNKATGGGAGGGAQNVNPADPNYWINKYPVKK